MTRGQVGSAKSDSKFLFEVPVSAKSSRSTRSSSSLSSKNSTSLIAGTGKMRYAFSAYTPSEIMFILHFLTELQQNLGPLVEQFGYWTYAILFLIIFCETGLVITPFLPGDSLLFAAGSIIAIGSSKLDINILVALLTIAAVLGDTCNYSLGHLFGDRLFKDNARILKTVHLEKAHAFYEKYGSKAIVIARFVPIIRTFIPFTAGMASMPYQKFVTYNVLGATLWVALVSYTGYFFGNIPLVKNNFGLVVIAIIIISILPAYIEFVRAKRKNV